MSKEHARNVEHTKEVEKQKFAAENIEDTDTSKDNINKKGEKRYELDTLKRPVPKEEEEVFNEMDKDQKKKYMINQWIQENRTLDKKDMHEVSLEEEKLVGLQS